MTKKKPSKNFTKKALVVLGEQLSLTLGSDEKSRLEQLGFIISGALEAGGNATFGVCADRYDTAAFARLKAEKRIYEDGGVRHIEYPLSGLKAVLFNRHAETPKEEKQRFSLTVEALKRGFAITMLDYPRAWANLTTNDGCNADFFDYDTVLQCAFFGEVLYG